MLVKIMQPCTEVYQKKWGTAYSGYRLALGVNSDSDMLGSIDDDLVMFQTLYRLQQLEWQEDEVTELWVRHGSVTWLGSNCST